MERPPDRPNSQPWTSAAYSTHPAVSPTRVSSPLEEPRIGDGDGSSSATTAERDDENRFATESAFITRLRTYSASGCGSSAPPDGTIVRDERALRALIAASAVGR